MTSAPSSAQPALRKAQLPAATTAASAPTAGVHVARETTAAYAAAHQSGPAAGAVTEQAMAAAGLRAFERIAQAWGLTVDEQLRLLGQPPRSTYFAWRRHPERASLPRDTLERLSNLLGIWKSLQILLPEARAADAWVRQPNTAALFGGGTALQRMLAGNVSDLHQVRQYLDGVRGAGWA